MWEAAAELTKEVRRGRRRGLSQAVVDPGGSLERWCGEPCRFSSWRGTGLRHPSPGFRLSFRKLRVTEDHWRRRVSKEQKMNTKSDLEERNRPTTAGSEYFETVIIGGGQAG